MAAGEGAYNPLVYHDGTVWPHDNSLIAWGLARSGRSHDAARILRAMVEAAAYFDYRLPEVFAGFARHDTRFPVEYPTASSPQAWAAATPVLLLQVRARPRARSRRTGAALRGARLARVGSRGHRSQASTPSADAGQRVSREGKSS